jgi:hypothetical protein
MPSITSSAAAPGLRPLKRSRLYGAACVCFPCRNVYCRGRPRIPAGRSTTRARGPSVAAMSLRAFQTPTDEFSAGPFSSVLARGISTRRIGTLKRLCSFQLIRHAPVCTNDGYENADRRTRHDSMSFLDEFFFRCISAQSRRNTSSSSVDRNRHSRPESTSSIQPSK